MLAPFLLIESLNHELYTLVWINMFPLLFDIALVQGCMRAKLLQSRPSLCDSVDCSLPGFSVHGILQARILEWVAIFLLQSFFPTQ